MERFHHWLQHQQPDSKPNDMIQRYRANLLQQGVTEDEARRRMSVISNSIFTRPERSRGFMG